MAHLTYAKISRLAGRKKDVEIKFDRNVNVFFGVNGVGKTTLLKILHSALYQDASIVDGLPFEAAEVGVFSISEDREIIRTIKNEPMSASRPSDEDILREIVETRLADGSFTREIRRRASGFVWKTKNKKGNREDRLRLQHEYLPTTRLISAADLVTARRAGTVSDEAGINNMMEAQLQEQWIKYFSPFQLKLQDVQQKGIARILSTVLSPGSVVAGDEGLPADIAYSLARKFLTSQNSLKMPSSKSEFIKNYGQNKSLAAVVNEIAGIQKNVEELRRPKDQLQELLNKLFLNKTIDLSGGNIKVSFSADDVPAKDLKLSQLSSGEKQALFILIHALRADENSLIIDEPELSMHIDWQRQLIGAIRMINSGAQVVMATHSPEMMADVSDNHIFEI